MISISNKIAASTSREQSTNWDVHSEVIHVPQRRETQNVWRFESMNNTRPKAVWSHLDTSADETKQEYADNSQFHLTVIGSLPRSSESFEPPFLNDEV